MRTRIASFIAICMGISLCTTAQPITNLIEYTVIIKQDGTGDHDWFKENMEASGRMPWLGQLIKDVENGKLAAYDPIDAKLEQPLTKAEIAGILYFTDTVYIESPNPPYDLEMVVITEDPDISLIDRIKFREKWVWHKKKGLIKEVIAFAPMIASLDRTTGEVRGWMPLFWIRMH